MVIYLTTMHIHDSMQSKARLEVYLMIKPCDDSMSSALIRSVPFPVSPTPATSFVHSQSLRG